MREEKLNAITRIVIMLSALGYIITGSSNFIIIFVIMLAIILLFYNLTKSQIVRETFTNQYFSNERIETPYKPDMRSETSEKMTPSINNPLMNVLTTGKDVNRPPAAPGFNPIIEKEINTATKEMVLDNFNEKEGIDERLFQDLGDNFLFNRSMIQFNSNPNTQIPNDQKSFAEYCYGDMISCKEGNPIACTQNMPPHWINGNQ